VEVEELRKVKKDDLLEFYQDNVAFSEKRKKLSCEVLSTLGGGPIEDSEEVKVTSEPVKRMSEVKPSLGFYPLPESFIPLQELRTSC